MSESSNRSTAHREFVFSEILKPVYGANFLSYVCVQNTCTCNCFLQYSYFFLNTQSRLLSV